MSIFFNVVERTALRYCVFVCVFLFSISASVSEEIVIQTKDGPVRGQTSDVGSFSIFTFKNIPYAKPPIGYLRFEQPQDADPWLTVSDLKQHDEDIVCPQISLKKDFENVRYGQEDCLLLDVYVRKNFQPEAKSLPVLIYFHAGRFSSGSKEEYHPEFLLSMHNIIVVIPNYRLGILGFLSTADSKVPGNLGLWDQRQSMKWVHNNIEYFGGDNNRVTIAGHDAGGASVGFHILSPQSHNLFSAAISGSGTALDPWAFSQTFISTVPPVAERVGCLQNSSDDVVSCLKQCNLDLILDAQLELKKIQFLPTTDGMSADSFIPEAPRRLYQFGYQKNVTYIAGVTRNDASVEVSREFPNAVKHKHLDSIIQHLLRPYLKDTPDYHIIAKAAKYHYLRGAVIPSFESILPQMERMMTDFLYNGPLHATLSLHSLRTPDTFMYVFDFEDELSPLGVNHMADAFYIFNTTLGEQIPRHSFKTDAMKKTLCDTWGHFIESKSPGPTSFWKRFRSLHHTNYVEISENFSHKINYRKEAMEFWNLLVPDLKYYHNLSTIQPTHASDSKDLSYTGWGLAGIVVVLIVLSIAMVGVVSVTRRRYAHSSIIPISSSKDDVKYSSVG